MAYKHRPRGTTEQRYWPKVIRTEGCWGWDGSTKQGYGCIWDSGSRRAVRATHVSWEIHHGEKVPAGLLVCHRCDNPPCTNPDHLFLGTKKDNARDMVEKARGHITRGEDSHFAILTTADVISIRERYVSGKGSGKRGNSAELAKEYGITRHHISDIAIGKAWAHVPMHR